MTHKKYFSRCLLFVALSANLVAVTSAAPNAPLSERDKVIVDAFVAYGKQDLTALANLRLRANDHVLLPYVQYWWFNANLTHAASFAMSNSEDIRRFINANADTLQADNLRRDWLRLLGRQQAWPLFASEESHWHGDDVELTCLGWQQRWAMQKDRAILSEAKALWKDAKPLPDSCYAVFDIVADEKMLSANEVWQRVRVLLDNNQLADVKKTLAYLSIEHNNFEAALSRINKNAQNFLQHESLQTPSPQSVELFLYALSRLARNDAAKAAGWMLQHEKVFAEKEAAYAWAQIGMAGAMQHEAEAPIWFVRAGNVPMNDTQLGWKARAALRLGDWPQVEHAIEAMSPAEKRDPTWRYWLARTWLNQKKIEPATALLETLATENNFYGLLAAEELHISRATSWEGFQPSKADVESVANRDGIKRALALYQLAQNKSELKNEALREWQFAIRNMDDKQLLAAAHIAQQENIPDRAISTAERTLVLQDFSLRYPIPYRAELSAGSRQYALDEPWIYGLIRQESRFIADVKSRVGASGLMQLMPATAKSIAKKISMPNFNFAKLGDVKTNIDLGVAYLRHILDDLGDKVLATAGYNAGPGRAKRWQADAPMEAAIYIESIPFPETRDYVKKVMANEWFYTQRLGLATIGLKKYMGMVPAKNASASTHVIPINKDVLLETFAEK